jgi:hypothetical protein
MAGRRGNPNWVKGVSGNPNGRPKKPFAFSTAIAQALRAKGPDGLTYRRRIARKLVELADQGSIEAIKILLDRVDGKVVERREITGPEGVPLELRVVERIVRVAEVAEDS